MTTPLTDAEVEHLLKFVGYGSLDAPVWFLGMEEAGAGEANIRTRLTFDVVEDCAKAHRKLGIYKHHWGGKVIQPTWRGMCWVMLALDGRGTSAEQIREYQANELGREHGSTLLAELMPIPKPNVHGWDYSELMPQFRNRSDYYLRVKPRRIDVLKRLMNDHRPKLVVAYGKSYWSDYQQLLEPIRFNAEGQFLVGGHEGMLAVLTDHFTARTMNGQLDRLVSIITSRGYGSVRWAHVLSVRRETRWSRRPRRAVPRRQR